MTNYAAEMWKAHMNCVSERMQAEVDAELAAGHHPFTMLEKLNSVNTTPMGDFCIVDVTYRTTWLNNQNQKTYDLVQRIILEKLQPYWDLAAAHFHGKFHMRFAAKRNLGSHRYELKVFLCFNNINDFDAFKIMSKLHDLPECVFIEY